MYAPSARSTFDALRAELERIWSAPTFDPLAYARCAQALKAELLRQGLTKSEHEMHEIRLRGGRKSLETRKRQGTLGGWKARRDRAKATDERVQVSRNAARAASGQCKEIKTAEQ